MTPFEGLTISGAAKELGISRQRIYQLIEKGRLPVRPVKVTEYRVYRAGIEEFKKQRQERQAA